MDHYSVRYVIIARVLHDHTGFTRKGFYLLAR